MLMCKEFAMPRGTAKLYRGSSFSQAGEMDLFSMENPSALSDSDWAHLCCHIASVYKLFPSIVRSRYDLRSECHPIHDGTALFCSLTIAASEISFITTVKPSKILRSLKYASITVVLPKLVPPDVYELYFPSALANMAAGWG